MLVFIVGRQIDLGDFPMNNPLIGLRERADLKSPVVGDVDTSGQTCQETELSRQGVIEAPVIPEETLQFVKSPLVHDSLHGVHKGRDEEPRNPSFHGTLLWGDTGIVALAKLEVIVGIGRRLDEPPQKDSVVSDDVTIMKSDYL